MKILILHNKYQDPGGEDAVVENETQLLRNYGNEVEQLFFSNNDIKPLAQKIKMFYKIFYNRESARILEDKIKEFQPDVLHVHNLFYVASPAILYVAEKFKLPVVLTIHNYRLICSGQLLMRDAEVCELCTQHKFPLSGVKYACFGNSRIKTAQITLATGVHKILGTWQKKVNQYICLTHFSKQKIAHSSLEIPEEQISVKGNFVEDAKPSFFNEREHFYLFIGRLSPEKGVDILLAAAKRYDFKLEIIGDGELRSLVEKHCHDNPNIKFWGFQNKDLILERLKKSRALLFSSVCYEGLPMTVLEAFSTGTPVISSDIGNINEIITNGYNGLHFKTKNSEDLADKIKDFDENHLKYQQLYQNARETYLKKYTPQQNYTELMAIYAKAMHKD
jgi:glycosyltransferase involved in cell wall biosynthesis